jgi:hypothetical protein
MQARGVVSHVFCPAHTTPARGIIGCEIVTGYFLLAESYGWEVVNRWIHIFPHPGGNCRVKSMLGKSVMIVQNELLIQSM